MSQNASKFLEHLDKIFDVEPSYFRHSKEGESPPFHSLTYKGIPQKGMVTGFTLGMSFVAKSKESNSRTELMISIDTTDDVWVLALADIGYRNRGNTSYEAGDTINFNCKISEESEMTSFLVWHQGVIHEDHETICLPDWHIRLLQLFPIHDDERILVHEHGPEWLFEHVTDPSDIKRTSVANKFKT